METIEKIMSVFVNIAENIYESAYGNKMGKEATLNIELKDGRKMNVKITIGGNNHE
jgi:hypothetical protein